MSDDKSKVGKPDRARVAATEAYEVNYFARKHGLTSDQARELIHQHGADRTKLDAAVERLKSR